MRRQHPIIALRYAAKNIWLLVFPLLRGIKTLRFSLEQAIIWLQGAWFDILIILLIIGIGVWKWYYTRFEIRSDCVSYTSGRFIVVKSIIPFSSISTVSFVQGPFMRIIRGVKASLDTNSGEIKGVDLKLTMRVLDSERLSSALNITEDEGRVYAYKPLFRRLLFFSFAFSSTLSGAVYAATFFFQAGRIFDAVATELFTKRINDVSERFPVRVSPFAFAVAAVIILSWLISFVMNLLRYTGFTLYREDGAINIKSGTFTSYKHRINPAKINYADLRQNFITRLFRVMSVSVNCTGYGKGKNESPVFVPLTLKRQVISTLRLTLPDLCITPNAVRTRRRSIFRFIWVPLLPLAGFAAIAVLADAISPRLSSLILFVSVMAVIPCSAMLFTRISEYLREGMGFDDKTLTIRCSKGMKLHTIIINKKHISKVVVSQNIFQKLGGSCDVAIFTYSERTKFYLVRSMGEKKAMEFLESASLLDRC